MAIEKTLFAGWSNCIRLANGQAELILTTDVGPRVLSYKTARGENVLWVNDGETGKSGEKTFQVRGGHRIWIAPEDNRTYAPDNVPVQATPKEPLGVVLENAPTDPWHIRKTLTVSLAADSSAVLLDHRLTNEGSEPVSIASWAMTVMTPGGIEIIPQPPLREHGKGGFTPDRVIVPWSYMDFSDPRWKFGRRFWLLTPAAGTGPTKLGFAHKPRWIAWTRKDALFIKAFEYEQGATYPDLGCNYETFTQGDFLELETLSPLRTLAAGQSVGHTETWHLFDGVSAPDPLDDSRLEQWLAPFLAKIGIV